MGRALLIAYVLLVRASLVFSLLTLGAAIRWMAYVGDVVRTQDYYDFAEPLLPSPQVTFTYTETIIISPTIVTHTDTYTATFTRSSETTPITYTHTGTYADTYSSGQYYQTYYATRYGNSTTFAPPVATVARPSCRGGCTVAPTEVSTVTPTPTMTSTPTPSARSPADVQRLAEVRRLVADAKHRTKGALVCLSLLMLGLLLHIINLAALLMRAASPEQLFDGAINAPPYEHEEQARRVSRLRWAVALLALLTIYNLATGIAFLVLVAPPQRFPESFIVFAVFLSLFGAACIGVLLVLLVVATRAREQNSDRAATQHDKRNDVIT